RAPAHARIPGRCPANADAARASRVRATLRAAAAVATGTPAAGAPRGGSEGDRTLRGLRPLGGRFPDADVEDRVAHGLGEPALQLVEEVAGLVFGGGLDVGERRDLVDVLVIQVFREVAQVLLDLDEVEGEAAVIELLPDEGDLDDVAMAVQTL